MSADGIVDCVSTYARPLGWDLAPHDVRRTFAKLARGGRAPLEQIPARARPPEYPDHQRYLGSELNLVDVACDRLGIRVESSTNGLLPLCDRQVLTASP